MRKRYLLGGTYLSGKHKGVSSVCKNLHYSASSFELAVKHAVCQDKNMLQVFYKNTEQTVWSSVASLIAGHVIEYTESWVSRALFKKGTVVLVESPWRSVSGGRGIEDKTMGMIIFRSFSILPSHSAVGMSETGYHYYSRGLQRYHICNIIIPIQGVYEVLLCQHIQTNQIGTMYEPFSCCIWSFVNAELQILLISMLILHLYFPCS